MWQQEPKNLKKLQLRLYLSDMAAAVKRAKGAAAGDKDKLRDLDAIDTVQKGGVEGMRGKVYAYITVVGPGVVRGAYVPCERRYAASRVTKVARPGKQ